MKTFRCLLLSLIAATWHVYADRGAFPAPTGFVIQILAPTPAPEFVTLAPTVRLAGVVFSPQVPVAAISYASSSGAAGPCTLVSNCCWRSEPIALLPGTNFLTVTAIQAGQAPATASDALLAIRVTPTPPPWTNQPPVWTNHPPVFTNFPPACTNFPPVCSNHPPVIISTPPLFWGTNALYRYHLIAIDRDNDPLTLQLVTRGPVMTTITPITNGEWLILATLTNYAPAVRFRAVVSDGGLRPAVQLWPAFVSRKWARPMFATPRQRR